MAPQSSESKASIERTQPGPVRELAMKFDKETIVSPKGIRSFMTPPQSPAVFRSPQSKSMPKTVFMTPLQSPKINLVAERAAKFGMQTKPGKRPSFIQKDPHNPFNNSFLWKTDDQILLDEPHVPKAESMPELKVDNVVESTSVEENRSVQEAKTTTNDDDNTSITVPSDDSSFTATNDDSYVKSETKCRSIKQVDMKKEKKKKDKKEKKEKKESKKSKTKNSEKDTKERSSAPQDNYQREDVITRSYKSWDFGKPKKFDLSTESTVTRNAAIVIQRMMRGWWNRLNFRLQILTYRLENKEQLTSAALERVWNENQEKKDKFYEILKGKIDRRQDRELEKTVTCRQEGQQIIEYLKKDNKRIREDTDHLRREYTELKDQHARLEIISDQIARNMEELQVHAERFQQTHEQLIKVEPVYKTKAMSLEDACEQAKAYCETEHLCKLKYLRSMEKIVMIVQDRCTNQKLVDEIVDLVLSIDVKQNGGQ